MSKSEARFTPGPWMVAPSLNDDRIGIYDSEGYRVASVHDFNKSPANRANARLIAAAPALLEALREIEAHHAAQNQLKGRDEGRSKTLRISRAAIAAATTN